MLEKQGCFRIIPEFTVLMSSFYLTNDDVDGCL